MPIQVKLERTKVADRTWTFNLIVSGEVERTFYLARIKNGSMTLVNYEINQNGKQQILSAFFYVNIMGHDLDEWMHFDLETGEQIHNHADPRQAVGKPAEQNRFKSEAEKREAARKLRQILDKWGKKKDDKGERPEAG